MSQEEMMDIEEAISQATSRYVGDDSTNLIEAGMNSLAVMRLANLLRRCGARQVTFAKLMEQPTRASWRALAGSAGSCAVVQPSIQEPQGAERADAKPFPLTDIQSAYYFGRKDGMLMGGNGCHAYLELDGLGVDAERLQKAWRALFDAHPMLRARFTDDGMQYVAEEPSSLAATLAVYDLTGLSDSEAEKELQGIRGQIAHRKLDVESGQTCGLALVDLPGGRSRTCFDIDLLVCDVQSFQLIIRDLAALYSGSSASVGNPSWDFATYLRGQEQRRCSDRRALELAEAYWMGRIPNLPCGPSLPTVVDPGSVTRPRYANYARQFDADAYSRLKARAARRGSTVAMVLLGAFSQVMAAWSDDQRFLVNMPIYARDMCEEGIDDVVSDFSDTLLLEVDASSPRTFEEFLKQVNGRFLADMEHRSFSGVAVQRAVAAAGGPQSGLAPIVFACNLGDQLLSDEAVENLGSLAFMTSQTPQVQIDFQAFDHEGGLRLSWDAAEELFPQGMCGDMFDALCDYVGRLADSDDAWAQQAEIMPSAQRQRREADLEAIRTAEPELEPLHAAFMECARREPDAVALIDAATGSEVSYGEVFKCAAGIANMLVESGVDQGSLVAVSLERGIMQVCSLLGVAMAGCAYVPIDVSQPSIRKQLMRDKLQLRYLLTDDEHAALGEMFDSVLSVADASPADETLAERIARDRMPLPESTAYIIMTSGSTGDPKGVELSHGAAWNTISDVNSRICVGPGDRMLGVSNFDFDLSVYDVFGMLGAGATLVVMPEEARRDAFRELEYVQRYGVSLWNTVPLILDMVATAAESSGTSLPFRAVMLSGDWVGMDLPARLAACAPGCRFIAMGGATEAAIWLNWQEVTLPLPESWTSVPYGRPLRAQCYRVVDARGEDRPDWVAGELLIGGFGVAEGYRGDAELTAQRFFESGGTRWYRTGDMGRIWPDGTIEFMGRRDFQVKVRGHRIELGEVESAISDFSSITACAACATPDARSLAAVVQVVPGVSFDPEQLKSFLALRLPDYMVPARFVVVEAMPLAANGKLDRKQVAELVRQHADQLEPGVDAPKSGTECAIAEVWQQAVGVGAVSRDDNYFEVGGNSLTAVRVISAVRDRFDIEVDTADVFTHPSIASFAQLVDERIASRDGSVCGAGQADEGLGWPAIEPCGNADDEPFELTPLQRAYMVGRQDGMVLGGQSTRAYFEVAVSDLDMSRLSRAMAKLVEAQGALRLSVDEGGAVQVMSRRVVPVVIPLVDVSHLDEDEWEGFLESRRDELMSREFDLSHTPLWSMEVTRWNDEWHIHFCHDGMILDGWSAERFFDLLEQAYRDEPVAPGVTYRDYVMWLKRVRESAAYERDRDYWLGKAEAFPDEQALDPLVAPKSVASPRIANESRAIPAALSEGVRAAAAAHGMTTFAVMLSAFGKALESGGGRHDFLINTPVAFRPQEEAAEGLLGECSDYRLFRFSTDPEDTLWATARNVAAQLSEESRHGAYCGSDLSRALQQRMGATIAAPIVFTSTADVQTGASTWYSKVMSRTHTSQVWLDAVVMPAADGLALSVDYVADLIDPLTVRHIAESFLDALNMLVEQPSSWDSSKEIPVSEADRAIIDAANETDAPLACRSYAPLLREALAAHADRVFVRGGADPMTYAELEQLMGRLSAAIEATASQAGADARAGVGIALGKGIGQIAAALACAAAGRPFMPIDTEYSAQAVARCVEAADLALVLVDDDTQKNVQGVVPTVNVNRDLPSQGEVVWRDSNGEDAIAFINTSGSTGYPKSIRITHEGVVNCLVWSNKRFGVTEESCAIALTNFAHDMALYDTLGMVIAGAGVVVLDEGNRREPRAWAQLIDECGVTIWNSVPSFMRMLFEAGGEIGESARSTLACVIHGGDWLDPELARKIMTTFPQARLFNVGGPTETTIWNIAHEVAEEDLTGGEIPYGKPIQNTRYHVLDDRMSECAIGVPGVMYVSGVGVSPGYAGRGEDSSVFGTWNGARVCRTGDRGVRLPNGELKILGRADLQVKVNGKRIEVGGIERLLGQEVGVSACAVVVNESTGRLVAYFSGDRSADAGALREGLSRKLPTYMVPTRFVKVDELPLTRNGKPDRKRLAQLELPAQADEPVESAPAPSEESSLEEMLGFCREVIGDDTIGLDDNFFEVGGDSLAAMKIGSWAYDRFGTELSVVTIMTQPTVREWAHVVTGS